jgi:hypothetical protein
LLFSAQLFLILGYNQKSFMKLFSITALCALLFVGLTSFGQEKMKVKTKSKGVQPAMTIEPLDTLLIERVTGIKGKSNKGEYKITIPQNDLNIDVDGFRIIPAMGLGTWIAFTPVPEGAMIMGDIVLTENDLKPVQARVIQEGLTISAIHNHFVRNHPNVMYMHIGGAGNTEVMAKKARAVLDAVAASRGHNPAAASVADVPFSIDINKLNGIVGSTGELSKGVYKYTIGRPDVPLKEHGAPISSFLGFNTWAAFQGSEDHAAVAGDFTMTENEVAPVIKSLVEHGIEVVAVHNHMVHEQPRIFFLHYWGVGKAVDLARGLKAALDQTGKQASMNMDMHHGG